MVACSAPDGYSALSGDCNDRNEVVYPDADEICDGLDNDCDLSVDEEVRTAYYLDRDNDGFGDPSSLVMACDAPSQVYLEMAGDCDDFKPSINPDAMEVCDGVDQDCDGKDSECSSLDLDSDGYSEADGDCDDWDPDIYPGALEDPQETGYGDGLDNDCDNLVDEGTLRFDDDGDGYAEVDGDCDDGDPQLSPGAEEVPYDGVDQDCDGADLVDADGDGFVAEVAGTGPGPFDCDDLDAAVYPGAEELEDGLDNDCNGQVDDLEMPSPDVSPTPEPGDGSEGCTCNSGPDQTRSGQPALVWFSVGVSFLWLRRGRSEESEG